LRGKRYNTLSNFGYQARSAQALQAGSQLSYLIYIAGLKQALVSKFLSNSLLYLHLPNLLLVC
jgi:hypothetical protein